MAIQRAFPSLQCLFDASSLINIERLKKMSFLRRRKSEVRIPEKVADEVNQHGTPLRKFLVRFPDVVTGFKDNKEAEEYLRILAQPGIHKGEAAAIAMAVTRRLRLVVDDNRPREKANSHGVQTLSWKEFVES